MSEGAEPFYQAEGMALFLLVFCLYILIKLTPIHIITFVVSCP